MKFLSFVLRWLLPIAYIFALESYTTGWVKIWLFIGGMSIFFIYLWATTRTVGVGDDDPSGNDNVGRKFTDIM